MFISQRKKSKLLEDDALQEKEAKETQQFPDDLHPRIIIYDLNIYIK